MVQDFLGRRQGFQQQRERWERWWNESDQKFIVPMHGIDKEQKYLKLSPYMIYFYNSF